MSPSYNVSALKGIQNKISGSASTFTTQWESADIVIVVVGINDLGEAFDRPNMGLLSGQNEFVAQVLAKKPKQTIVVYTGGSFTTAGPWSSAPAVVIALYPGQEQGNALADILFGDYNPAGRLSITFPKDSVDVPPWGTDYPTYENPEEGRGYSYYDHYHKDVLFPFGYGLSYSTFSYGNLSASGSIQNYQDTASVNFDLTNTSNRDGEEVPQLYVSALQSKVPRRVKDLKSFQRISLKTNEKKACHI